jgi:hypothetical protein
MSSPRFEFLVDDFMLSWVVIRGRLFEFRILRTIWAAGDEDKFVTAFVLN